MKARFIFLRWFWLGTWNFIREVGAMVIGIWCVFFYTDCPVLDKLFELCSFMQIFIPHENHGDGFFTYSYPVPRNNQFWHHFYPIRVTLTFVDILIPPFISHKKDDITEFRVRNASNNIQHSVNQQRTCYFQMRLLMSQKVIKWTKEEAILIVLFWYVSFSFHFYYFIDSIVFFASLEISSL